MKTTQPTARTVKQIENCWIPLADGTRLAARVWLPEDAEENPVPAILEYLPYHKTFGTVERDALTHPYFASHGYAGVRVDIRGTGDSEGLITDEYTLQEQFDCLEVLRWLSQQSWCSGSAGMMGISWGGFNALQVASMRPPELKAIITLASSDDRYSTDVHFAGGCLLACESLPWSATMLAYDVLPPDPRFAGNDWLRIWRERLEKAQPFIHEWLSHQTRDDYWKQGSICENYAAVQCAVYAIGGWADPYHDTVLRLMENLSGPRKGLIGPWAHCYPHIGRPGPAIGFLQEALRWWDHWLKGEENGIMSEPSLQIYVQENIEPNSSREETPGYWIAEAGWPTKNVAEQEFRLAAGLTADSGTLEKPDGKKQKSQSEELEVHVPLSKAVGAHMGVWCAHGEDEDFPLDQQTDDAECASFTSLPLTEPLELLGFPMLHAVVSCDKPLAMLCVRLCEVQPDGGSTLLSWGVLNLAHRDSDEAGNPLKPGQRYSVRVELNSLGHRVEVGNRLRVAVSSSLWPFVWPSPEPAAITLHMEPGTLIELPVRTQPAAPLAVTPLPPPQTARRAPMEILHAGKRKRDIVRDERGVRVADVRDHGMKRQLRNGIAFGELHADAFVWNDETTTAQSIRVMGLRLQDHEIVVRTQSLMLSTKQQFRVTQILEAFHNNQRVFQRPWVISFDRRFI